MKKNNIKINEDYAYVSRVGGDYIFVDVGFSVVNYS